jgi:hypothetical protein
VAEAFKNHFRKSVEFHLEHFYLAVTEPVVRTEEFPAFGKAQHGSPEFSLGTPPSDATSWYSVALVRRSIKAKGLARGQPCFWGVSLVILLADNLNFRATKSRRIWRLSASAYLAANVTLIFAGKVCHE